jgi:hypothetical protein
MQVDERVAEEALARLIALYKQRESTGEPDPFLTEALADFTDDRLEAIRLYHLALEQCELTPGEPTHTKRIGLARCLHEVGRNSEAQEQLLLARREAFAAKDSKVMSELDELVAIASVDERNSNS